MEVVWCGEQISVQVRIAEGLAHFKAVLVTCREHEGVTRQNLCLSEFTCVDPKNNNNHDLQ